MSAEASITVALGRFGCVIGQGLLGILGAAEDLRVVGMDLDRVGIERVVARGRARVVVLDEDTARMRDLVRGLCGARAGVGIVALAHRPTRAYATRMLACGVSACLSTDSSAEEIVGAVRLTAAGNHALVAMSPRSPWAARAVGMSALTRREREVLELLGEGRKNAEIATALNISGETVRMHAKHVYRKLGVCSRGELLGVEV